MIIHTVVFKLKHAKGSSDENNFLAAVSRLASIPGVYNLQSFRQIGKKNNFDFGLSMEFETMDAYQAYNRHGDHQGFIQNFWVGNVEDFMEIDYEPLT